MAATTKLIQFRATLYRPGGPDLGAEWSFLRLPQDASDQLTTRAMVSVEGAFQGVPFAATLEPDGEGGHWLRVKPELIERANVSIGETVVLKISPAKVEPEPEVPDDFQAALTQSSVTAQETWMAITPMARRDWIFWIVSGKKAETRVKRISVAIDKLSKGNRRPCCFDRTGMYDKSLSAPIADES